MNLTDNPYTEGYFEYADGSNYRNYGDDPGWEVTAKILRGFLPELSYPQLLELGSAKGYFLAAAHRAGFVPTGVDISKHAVDATPDWIKRRNHHWDVRNLLDSPNVGPEQFDVVCSWEFFEHIEESDLVELIVDSLKLLKPGGLYVHRIALLDGEMDEDHDSTHVSMFERIDWELEFEYYGLRHEPEMEDQLRVAFLGRDWAERFFVWRRPENEML